MTCFWIKLLLAPTNCTVILQADVKLFFNVTSKDTTRIINMMSGMECSFPFLQGWIVGFRNALLAFDRCLFCIVVSALFVVAVTAVASELPFNKFPARFKFANRLRLLFNRFAFDAARFACAIRELALLSDSGRTLPPVIPFLL